MKSLNGAANSARSVTMTKVTLEACASYSLNGAANSARSVTPATNRSDSVVVHVSMGPRIPRAL